MIIKIVLYKMYNLLLSYIYYASLSIIKMTMNYSISEVQSTAHQTIHFGLLTALILRVLPLNELRVYSGMCCWPYNKRHKKYAVPITRIHKINKYIIGIH
jgi:hypothetical protein